MSVNFYNAEQIEQLMKGLSKLQESIETASTVFLKLGKDGYCQKLSSDWEQYFKSFTKPEQADKRLCLLYLANDILQKCRAHGCEQYLDYFKSILIDGFKLISASGNEKLRKDTGHILEIWRERKVFQKDATKAMQTALNGPPADTQLTQDISLKRVSSEGADSKQGDSLPDDVIPIPQDLVAYVESVNNLKKWSDKTKDAESKLSRMLMDGGVSFNGDEANLNLSEYKRCLELQQKYRTTLLKSLLELIRQSDTDNMKSTHMMKKVISLMDELEKFRV